MVGPKKRIGSTVPNSTESNVERDKQSRNGVSQGFMTIGKISALRFKNNKYFKLKVRSHPFEMAFQLQTNERNTSDLQVQFITDSLARSTSVPSLRRHTINPYHITSIFLLLYLLSLLQARILPFASIPHQRRTASVSFSPRKLSIFILQVLVVLFFLYLSFLFLSFCFVFARVCPLQPAANPRAKNGES